MKLYHKIALPFLALTLGLASCKKDYLERRPTDQAALEDVFNSITGARAAVNGIHRMMYEFGGGQHYEFGQPSINLMFDLMGEDLIPNGQGHFNPIYSYQAARTGTGMGAYVWSFYYRMINNANFIVTNIDNVPGEQSERDEIKAQALFYRAYAYYNLINMYMYSYKLTDGNITIDAPLNYDGPIVGAPGVPLYTEPTQVGKPRATVAQVYTQINADLTSAIDLFDGSGIARGDKSQIDGSVARGLAARVALVQQDWTKAEVFAREARQSYSYMEGNQLLSGFNDVNNQEWMWGSSINTEQATSYASFISFMDRESRGYALVHSQMVILNDLFNRLIDTGDVRKLQWTSRIQAGRPGNPYVQYEQRKFQVKVKGTWLADYPLMRAAEMGLIEAEAMAHQGKLEESGVVLEDLIKTRQPNFVAYTSTSDTLLKQIWIQRRIELWGEGARFFDIKRQGSGFDGRVTRQTSEIGLQRTGNFNNTVSAGVRSLAPSDSRFLFRIPNGEILQNPSRIPQNP